MPCVLNPEACAQKIHDLPPAWTSPSKAVSRLSGPCLSLRAHTETDPYDLDPTLELRAAVATTEVGVRVPAATKARGEDEQGLGGLARAKSLRATMIATDESGIIKQQCHQEKP